MPIQIFSNSGVLTCAGKECIRSVNPIAKQLHSIATDIARFFFQRFKLNGVDGKGKIPPFSIGWDTDNAAWVCRSDYIDETCILKFHNRRAIDPKVVAHEYTHAIIAHLGNLPYFGESGALNESICDVMAIAYASPLFSSESAKWRIADRDFKLCSKMSTFKTFTKKSPDHGHVHHNSQIANHAFYYSVEHCDRLPQGKVASVWFKAVRYTTADETFFSFAMKTITLAKRYFNPLTFQAILHGWLHVEVVKIQIPRLRALKT